MDRKISWMTGCHDEIELIYEKAEQNEGIGTLLSELEQMALKEAEESCGLLSMNDEPITKEMVMGMSWQDKEKIMYYLSGVGLEVFLPSMIEPKIEVAFGPYIKQVLGCTMFSLLNRLEKMDGSYNVRFPKATLELHIPLGGRAGMMKWTMLIMQLYPWLSVREVASSIVAKEQRDDPVADVPVTDIPVTNTQHSQPISNSEKNVPKKGFLSRLFGKH